MTEAQRELDAINEDTPERKKLDKIIHDVSSRQITNYEGLEPRTDEVLVGEIVRLRNESWGLRKEIRRLNTLIFITKK